MVISVPLAIALNRALRRRRSRSTMTDAQPPSARSLIKTRTPPWHKVAPRVIDAIFEALDATELFDCFVVSSMENNLVSRYEELGHENWNASFIRAQISRILCQTGFQKIAVLEKEVNNKRIDSARKIGLAATNLFEPAIAMSKDQIAGYIGMAAIYELLGVKAQCHEYAKRGLLELQEIRRTAAGQAMRGVYINGGIGYGLWAADTTTINPTTGACVLCVQQTQGGKGWLGTVGVGYDRQFTDRIVGGVFADADISSIKGTIQDQGPFFAGKIKETWSWAAGPRIGWLLNPQTLSYVNGGYTQTHFNSASMVDTFTGLSSTFVTPSFDKGGWFLGGGVERAFSLFGRGWFWRSEYRYANYGTKTLTDTSPGAGPVVFVPGLGAFANPQNSITFKPTVQTVRTEIVYKFNWPG